MRHDAIELATAGGTQQRRALHQVVERHRQHSSLGRTADRVPGSTDTLQQRRDAVRRSDLADEIDVPDIDAELEDAVATSAFRVPVLSRCSASIRRSFERLPW